jgi:chromosome segregation ATPase
MTRPSPRTAAANQARRLQTEQKLTRVADAVRHLQRAGIPVTYPAVAARAGVSRTFLYDNADARHVITAAAGRAPADREHKLAEADSQQEASWRARALNAEAAIKTAHAEIQAQRRRIGQLLGQLRTTESELTDDTIQRITTENTTLKQRVRQLDQDNRSLEERLQAARSNNRFLDRRAAGLEAQLAETQNLPALGNGSPRPPG